MIEISAEPIEVFDDQSHEPESPPTPISASLGNRVVPVAALAAVSAVLVWAYAAVFRSLWYSWMNDPNYSHGPFVIPVACLIAWQRLRANPHGRPRVWPWGVGLLLLVLAARVFFFERGNQWAEAMTLLPVIGCLVLTFGGGNLFGKVWPAIAFLGFMIPLTGVLNAVLAAPLQSLATDASCSALKLSGLWVIAEGNIIYVGNQPLEVANACNGLSMLMCLFATVFAAVALVPMPFGVRVVLILSAAPIALVSNVFRIAATAWCYHRFGPEVGARIAHDGAGWLMMPTALLLVGAELWLLNLLVVVEVTEVEPTILGKPLPGRRPPTPLDGPNPKPDAAPQEGR